MRNFSLFSAGAPMRPKETFRQPDVSPEIAETLPSLLSLIELGEATNINRATRLLPNRRARNRNGT